MDRLIAAIIQKQNPTVAGLDPKLAYIPEEVKEACFATYGRTLEGVAEALLVFNKGLIDALCDVVPAVKPQCAYYELYGWQGMRALHETILYAKAKGLYVLTDGKRGDIGTTMQAYGAAHLGSVELDGVVAEPFAGDALTVNGYLGSDGVVPLLELCRERDKDIFVLVKTSNPSSGELQDLVLQNGASVYLEMGRMCEYWGETLRGRYGYSAVGAVVGATYPEQLRELRGVLEHTFFLVPGYGAQGGGEKDVAPAFDRRGLGALINSSRGIMCAWQKRGCAGTDFAAAAREEALAMREALRTEIGQMG